MKFKQQNIEKCLHKLGVDKDFFDITKVKKYERKD